MLSMYHTADGEAKKMAHCQFLWLRNWLTGDWSFSLGFDGGSEATGMMVTPRVADSGLSGTVP